ncbi:hypothetical protein IWX78_001640 [Mycetocola sp. CAN_C7]|uniref:hypothetical protein n=1 Tax=Mycetocola sp. CAN_C7 TaxID=2787724 RepID=UPI0018CAABEF
MSDTNPTRPTEPIPPVTAGGSTGPTERTDPIGSSSPIDDSRQAESMSSWFQPDTTEAPETPATRKSRLPARFGTIFWGVLLLGFAAFMIANSVMPVIVDPVTWLIGGLIAVGAVLVVAGIAAAIRRTD